MNKTIILGIFVSVAIVSGILISSDMVFAAKIKIEPTLVTTNLLTGQVTCLDSSVHTVTGFFSFDKKDTISRGIIQGGQFDKAGPGSLYFGFSSGQFNEDSFEARAALTGDDLCAGFIPAVITFSGECGPGSTVNFATDSGIIGTATGNIACA